MVQSGGAPIKIFVHCLYWAWPLAFFLSTDLAMASSVLCCFPLDVVELRVETTELSKRTPGRGRRPCALPLAARRAPAQATGYS